MKAVVQGLDKDATFQPLITLRESLQKKVDASKPRAAPQSEEAKQIPAGGVAPDKIQEAEAKKNFGNEEYKKKNFQNAIKHYTEAIQINPNEIIYHSNVAAAYIELKQYD